MTKSETRGNGTQASAHLVWQGKGGVGKSFVSAILAQYFRRLFSETITQPLTNDLSRVGALGVRQRADCLAPTDGKALENQHDRQNTQSDEGTLPVASRERPADERRSKTVCTALLVTGSSKRTPSPGAD